MQALPLGLRAQANANYFSSLATQQRYQQDVYQATTRQRNFDATLTGSWGEYIAQCARRAARLLRQQRDADADRQPAAHQPLARANADRRVADLLRRQRANTSTSSAAHGATIWS